MRGAPTSVGCRAASAMRGRGFTLIEILIVVSILAILITVSIPSFYGSKKAGYESAAIAGMKSIAEAEELYYNLHSYYPGGTSQDHWLRLRGQDMIDPKAYLQNDTVDGFIKAYSISFFSNGPYPQDYSVNFIPLYPEYAMRTFVLVNGRIKDNTGFIQ